MMMETLRELPCPSCRKVNRVTAELSECSRCGCDLEMLIRIARLACDQHRQAWKSLVRGDWEDALNHARESWALKQDSQVARIAGLATAAQGDVETSTEWFDY